MGIFDEQVKNLPNPEPEQNIGEWADEMQVAAYEDEPDEQPGSDLLAVNALLKKETDDSLYSVMVKNMIGTELKEALESETRAEGIKLLKAEAVSRGLIKEEPEPEPVTTTAGAQMVPIELLCPNPNNPRKRFDEEELDKLTASVRQLGVLSPILVVADGEKYRIVAGERRYRAAKAAGFEEVPVLVRELTESEEFEVMLTENLQREDLDPIEEAQAYTEAVSRGWKQTELAERLGISQAQIANRIRLLKLPGEVQEDISREILSAGHGLALVKVAHVPGAVEEIKNTLVEENISVADALKEVDHHIAIKGTPLHKHTYSPPQFDVNKICLKSKCKMRLYGKRKYETIDEPYCMDPDCWVKHQEAARAAEIEKQAKDVLEEDEDTDASTVPRLRDLEVNEYAYFNPHVKIEDCAGCEHIVGALNYADELVKVCTDPECFRQKRNAAYEEILRKERAEQEAFEQKKEAITASYGIESQEDVIFMIMQVIDLIDWHSCHDAAELVCKRLGINRNAIEDEELSELIVDKLKKLPKTLDTTLAYVLEQGHIRLYQILFEVLLAPAEQNDDSWQLTFGARETKEEKEVEQATGF